MKKVLVLIMMVACASAYGYTTCMRNNTYFGIFKKNVDGDSTQSQSDATKKIWKVVYDYVTLTGYASCNDITGTANTPKTNLVTGPQDVGINCWCEMWPVEEDYGYETGPSSYWVFLKAYDGAGETASTCASNCAADCKEAMRSNATFRTAVFESMW